jgi:phosphoglycerol transferase MdoB-like AlkP superfamily enzyme
LQKQFNYSKFIVELIKYAWLTINILSLLLIILAGVEKIRRPEFKNLSANQFIIIGVILFVSIAINLFWMYRKTKSPSK